MTDFASAAMVRVLAQGMRELGFVPPPALSRPPATARVGLDLKRAVVEAALQQGGWGCLAVLARGLHRHAHEPTHRALASARDAADLLQRWGRLERYVHSRHRTDVLALAPGAMQLRHRALGAAPPPLPAEDLVVLGVLAALLEACALDVTATLEDGTPVWPAADASRLERAVARRATAGWWLRWRAAARREPEAAAPPPAAAGPPPGELFTSEPWSPLARAAAERLAADLAQPPALAELAAQLGRAPRSLQRALAAEGLGHARLLAEVRLRAAAWWLVRTDTPLAEVGFVCGYADQPHFTREFGRRVGLTPAAYRADFAARG